jgi:hypothetical protein
MTTAPQSPVTVNADRLFNKVRRYFGGLDSALYEAFQNARRSYGITEVKKDKADRPVVRLTYADGTLEIIDKGEGIQDVGKALSLAETSWKDDNIEASEDPAGLGLCALLANCTLVNIASTFGSLSVSSESFFTEASYRERLMGSIDTASPVNGTRIIMTGLHEALDEASMLSRVYRLAVTHQGIRVTFNGMELPCIFDYATPTFVFDNKVELYLGALKIPREYHPAALRNMFHMESVVCGATAKAVIQGQIMSVEGRFRARFLGEELPSKNSLYKLNNYESVTLHVPPGVTSPVTPKLPDRDKLVDDERTRTFLERVASVISDLMAGRVDGFVREALTCDPELKKTSGKQVRKGLCGSLRGPYLKSRNLVLTSRPPIAWESTDKPEYEWRLQHAVDPHIGVPRKFYEWSTDVYITDYVTTEGVHRGLQLTGHMMSQGLPDGTPLLDGDWPEDIYDTVIPADTGTAVLVVSNTTDENPINKHVRFSVLRLDDKEPEDLDLTEELELEVLHTQAVLLHEGDLLDMSTYQHYGTSKKAVWALYEKMDYLFQDSVLSHILQNWEEGGYERLKESMNQVREELTGKLVFGDEMETLLDKLLSATGLRQDQIKTITLDLRDPDNKEAILELNSGGGVGVKYE